jgi:predicted nucleic acid-binding protein
VILVDASVWIHHLRYTDERLTTLLDGGDVLAHPFVMGELALGSLRHRESFLNDMRELPQATTATDDEVLQLINRRPLFARGIGYIDAHLLAAVRLTPDAKLWTRDGRLRTVAAELGLAAMLPH